MKTVCQGCKKEIDPTANRTVFDRLCSACMEKMNADDGIELQEFIDGMPVPTIVLDSRGTLLTINECARRFLNKDLYLFRGHAPGKVFECEHALLPEGCGNTVHCSGCAIRIAINRTMATGNAVEKLGATLKSVKEGERREIDLYVSTRKSGSSVILQIEDAE